MSKRSIIALAGACAAVVWAAAASAQLEQGPAVPAFAQADSIVVQGAEFFDRIVYVPVTINGRGPFPYVLDTGAGQISAVDQAVADSLAVKSAPLAVGGGAGEEQVPFTIVEDISLALPGLSFDARKLIGIPLHRMDPHWGKRKDGLLGGDLLSTLVTDIDYDRERVVFHDARTYEHRGPGERVPLQNFGNYIFVQAQVLLYGSADPVEALMMVDTGVRITTFNAPFSRAHALAAQSPRTTRGVTGYGLGGVSRGVIGRVRGLRIGSILVENLVVDCSTDTTGVLASDNFSGIIGADVLSRFDVTIDYARSLLVLDKNVAFAVPSEFDMGGIRFTMEGERFDTIKVFSVFEPSPAAEAGIVPGDVVKTIDGRPAGSFTREELRRHMEREGATVRLEIERAGGTTTTAIRLRRLV